MAVGRVGDRQIRLGNIVGLGLVSELLFVEAVFLFLFVFVRNPDGLQSLVDQGQFGAGAVVGLFTEPVLAASFAAALAVIVVVLRIVREFARAYDLGFLRRR